MNILVTGGAGFIGSALCRYLAADPGVRVVNLDKLTYAGNLASVNHLERLPNYRFVQADICDERLVLDVLRAERIDRIVHLAAETHVDRSIDGPAAFVETNVVGTFRLLQAALIYWRGLSGLASQRFRLPSRFDGRGLWRSSLRYEPLHRGNALRSLVALLGFQGRLGPSGTGLAPYFRAAGHSFQLLEQLRSLSFSGEAHSAHDPECPR